MSNEDNIWDGIHILADMVVNLAMLVLRNSQPREQVNSKPPNFRSGFPLHTGIRDAVAEHFRKPEHDSIFLKAADIRDIIASLPSLLQIQVMAFTAEFQTAVKNVATEWREIRRKMVGS